MSPELAAPLMVATGFITAATANVLGRKPARGVRAIGTLIIVVLWLTSRSPANGSIDSIYAVTLFGLAATMLSDMRARQASED
mgnify:CR=1 FL=1